MSGPLIGARLAVSGPDPKIEIRCPRCSARYAITREAMEAFLAQ